MTISNIKEFREKEKLFLKKAKEIDDIKVAIKNLELRVGRNIRNSQSILEELFNKEKADLQKIERDIAQNKQKLDSERKFFEQLKKKDLEAVKQLAKEKSLGFPWLAKAFSDYFYLRNLEIANYLEKKSYPAQKAAEHVREIAKSRRQIERELRVAKYLLQYYENLFPWLVDFRGEDLDDLIKYILEKPKTEGEFEVESHDPVKEWLTPAEYQKLPRIEKFQLALERYWSKKKTKWEIGRDYERYIGYLFEKEGFDVYYQGIVEGLADLGRDLIATKGKEIYVIQCKYWSKEKTIHEKHICQFKGTILKYEIENPKMKVYGKFYTSTQLSETARKFAEALNIEPVENFPLKPYPSIKCNVSRKDGTKIYHLPFDQQYDKTLVEEERNECYVQTVQEAEDLGFRRAFRWHGLEEKEF